MFFNMTKISLCIILVGFCQLFPILSVSFSNNFINFHSIKFYVFYNPYKNPYNAAYHYTDICFLQEVRV